MPPVQPMARPEGPRIYNLFPLLCGPIARWGDHLDRIAAMGFDWIYLNPFHQPGFSGSLYAVKDYYRLHPLLQGDSTQPADALLRGFTEAAADRGLRVMMDLVVNHTAKDSVLVPEHPDWYAREPDGALRSPRAIDPDDATKVTVWGDLAEIDYGVAETRPRIVAYWKALLRHYLGLGFSGFRCDAAYQVPADVWAGLIAEARRARPGAEFFAETLGCRLEQVEALAAAGFHYIFNSVKWWDLRAPWALEQYERFRGIAPSVGFPESHDTERLADELIRSGTEDAGRIAAVYRLRYALAACFSTGVMMPIGYEYGFRGKLDVVRTRPEDWETPRFDLAADIAAINRMKASCPSLNMEGPQRAVPVGDGIVGLLRANERGADWTLFIANPHPESSAVADLDGLAAALGRSVTGMTDVTPGGPREAAGLRIRLNSLEWKLIKGD